MAFVNILKNEFISLFIHIYLKNGIFPDNLRYTNIVSEYQKYNINEKNFNIVNFDILSLINEYDKSHKEIYLNSAKSLIDWIIQENKEEDFTYIGHKTKRATECNTVNG